MIGYKKSRRESSNACTKKSTSGRDGKLFHIFYFDRVRRTKLQVKNQLLMIENEFYQDRKSHRLGKYLDVVEAFTDKDLLFIRGVICNFS